MEGFSTRQVLWGNRTHKSGFAGSRSARGRGVNRDVRAVAQTVSRQQIATLWNALHFACRANIAKCQGAAKQARQHESNARQAADALATAPQADVFWVTRSRAWFFAECGEGPSALAEWRKRMGKEPLGIDPMHYAACCCLFGDPSVRREAINALPDGFDAANAHAHLAKAYLLALSNASNEEVNAACESLLALQDPRREMQCGAVEVWLACKNLGKARATAASLPKDNTPEWNKHWDLFLQYVAGELNDDRFIQECEAMNPPVFQVKAAYLAGLKAFAEGRSADATKHFRECRKTGCVFASWYWWSKVFLERLGDLPLNDDASIGPVEES